MIIIKTYNKYCSAIKTKCPLGIFLLAQMGLFKKDFFQEGLKFGPGNGLCSNRVQMQESDIY